MCNGLRDPLGGVVLYQLIIASSSSSTAPVAAATNAVPVWCTSEIVPAVGRVGVRLAVELDICCLLPAKVGWQQHW